MPGEFDKQNNFLVDILSERYKVEFSEQPDFIFYSVFGIEYLGYRDCVRIFMDGEPVLPNFNDCDYAIGYAPITLGNRYLRAAGVLASSVGIEPSPDVQKRIVTPDMADRRFCNFIYSNSLHGRGAALRVDFCKRLMEYKRVDCPGRVLNNMPADALAPRYMGFKDWTPIVAGNDWQDSKQQFQRMYKFSIAFENLPVCGMTTEKMLNPFYAYSVPIYWGNPEVTKDFNPKAFINCADYGNDFDAVIRRVIELDNDDEQYLEMLRQPPFQPDYDFHQRDKLRDFLYDIVERGNNPVRNPEAVDSWETTSANLVLRWGQNYAEVNKAIGIFNVDSNIYKFMRRLQKFGDSKFGGWCKKPLKFIYRCYQKLKRSK